MSGPAAGGTGRRPHLAVAACARFPDLHDDWPLLQAALAEVGVGATTAVWNDPAVDWAAFDLVLASGTWDNIHHVEEFLAWADRVAGSGVPVHNGPATLRWNIDKHYLRALERAGVPVVPTAWVEPDVSDADVHALALPEDEVVVKPAVSGGGYRTARYQPHEHVAARAHVRELTSAGRTAMIQPYVARVDTEGETALVYIGGAFSHAVHKGPMIRRGVGPTDSLVENQVITGATATAPQLRVAEAALAEVERVLGRPTYARVDLVDTSTGAPALLELELLDPVLFFTSEPAGAERLARELARLLAAG